MAEKESTRFSEDMSIEALKDWINALRKTADDLEKDLKEKERPENPNPIYADKYYFFRRDD